VAVAFEGEYDTSYTEGDNRDVLPTDTMKNTVYALAARDGAGEPEAFGLLLGRHFMGRNPKLASVAIDLLDHGWSHMANGTREHGTAFIRRGPEVRTARVVTDRTGATASAGITDLIIMKTARSAFADFPRDEFTTLPETNDRHAPLGDVITLDFINTGLEPAARAGIELTLETAKELRAALDRAIAAAEFEEAEVRGKGAAPSLVRAA
jgi:urate oxidase